jgi:formyltetrahydrofolate synthetase
MLLVRKNMDVNERKKLFNITLKHNLKSRNNSFIVVQHFTVTVGSAIMIITSHLKIIVQRPLA